MKIRTAIVGVGNCASSLYQLTLLARKGGVTKGLSHPLIGEYGPEHIEIVAAFDVDERKIDKDLAEACAAAPNCTTKYTELDPARVKVVAGQVFDGVALHCQELVKVSEKAQYVPLDIIVTELVRTQTDVVVLYLPVNSNKAADYYTQAALQAKCALVNCTPARIATSDNWRAQFHQAGLPLLGDDIKSQIGSTSIHRTLITHLQEKGVQIHNTYQLNIGGNADFLNMRELSRGKDKKLTKELALAHLFSSPKNREIEKIGKSIMLSKVWRF